MDEAKRIGAYARRVRCAQGRTQDDVARCAGLCRPNLARFERGHHTPYLDTVSRVATALGMEPSQLVSAIDG